MLGSSPGDKFLPGNPFTVLGVVKGSLACTQGGCLSHRGHHKVAEDPGVMGTRQQVFKGMLRQPGKKSGEAKEEAGELLRRPVCSWQFLCWARCSWSPRLAQKVCVSSKGGIPKVAKRPLDDGDSMPGFQGVIETAWG